MHIPHNKTVRYKQVWEIILNGTKIGQISSWHRNYHDTLDLICRYSRRVIKKKPVMYLRPLGTPKKKLILRFNTSVLAC